MKHFITFFWLWNSFREVKIGYHIILPKNTKSDAKALYKFTKFVSDKPDYIPPYLFT